MLFAAKTLCSYYWISKNSLTKLPQSLAAQSASSVNTLRLEHQTILPGIFLLRGNDYGSESNNLVRASLINYLTRSLAIHARKVTFRGCYENPMWLVWVGSRARIRPSLRTDSFGDYMRVPMDVRDECDL